MTGGESILVGGPAVLLGMFGKEFGRFILRHISWRNGEAKEANINGRVSDHTPAQWRTWVKEDTRQVFEDALGQHVVPALNNQNERLREMHDTSKSIAEGITKLVTLAEASGRKKH